MKSGMKSITHRLQGFDITAHFHGPASPAAPLLVMVHGMMEPGEVWAPALEALAKRYRCVVLDLPWNGQQGGLWGQDIRPEAWLGLALERFGLAPDGWFAHSFGASVLLAWFSGVRAGRRPGSRAPAVLVSPFYKASHRDVTWPLFQRYVNRFTDFVEASIRVRMGEREVDSLVLARMTETARDVFGCYVWMQFWQLFSRMPFLAVDRLPQPMLILSGAEDLSSPLDDVLALDAALPDSRVEIYPGCGHFLLAARPRETTAAMVRFLAQVFPKVCPSDDGMTAPSPIPVSGGFSAPIHPALQPPV